MEKVSVCLAAYNGGEYLLPQVFSILDQLREYDELVVVDDCSSDQTVEKLIAINDPRLKIHVNQVNLGHVKTFERAITECHNDFIFLSDQDDIWVPGRMVKMLNALRNSSASVVATNFYLFSESPEFAKANFKRLPSDYDALTVVFRLFAGTIPYFGCCMAFKRRLLSSLLPFPSFVESHDLWLAFNGVVNGGIVHISGESLYHRIHPKNLTPKRRRSYNKVLKTRVNFLGFMVLLSYRRFARIFN